MAHKSLNLWDEFFQDTGNEHLFQRTGALWLTEPGDAHANASRVVLRRNGVSFEDLAPGELQRRYPQIQVPAKVGAIYEPNAGAVMARQAVQAVVAEFMRLGGVYPARALTGRTCRVRRDGLRVWAVAWQTLSQNSRAAPFCNAPGSSILWDAGR